VRRERAGGAGDEVSDNVHENVNGRDPGGAPARPVRVYFLGSGRLGLPVLEELERSPRITLLGVGTQPDRPGGRKRRLLPTPIGQAVAERGGEAEKIDSVNAPAFLDGLRERAPELIVLVAFAQLLRTAILELPEFGCLNVHASLLPRHRGASPVAAAILAGDVETGVSLMRMDEGLDTGPVYRMIPLPIAERDTAQTLEERLAAAAAERIVECVWQTCREGLEPTPQSEQGATYAPKLTKQDGEIDWRLPADVIERRIRALMPWPRAYFRIAGPKGARRVQITEAALTQADAPGGRPGEVRQADGNGWVAACGSGAIRLLRVVPEGRGEMTAADFLLGSPTPVGAVLCGRERGKG